MMPITLYRINADKNMYRFYHLEIQQDLFGEWCCIREWGRIGRTGRMRVVPYPTQHEAESTLHRQVAVKQRKAMVELYYRQKYRQYIVVDYWYSC